MTSPKYRTLRIVGIAFLVATVIGLAETAQVHVGSIQAGRPIGWLRSATSTIPSWYIVAALVPLILMVARRFPLEALKSPKAILVHLFAAFVFSVVHLAASTYVSQYVLNDAAPTQPFGTYVWRIFTYYFVSQFLQYWSVVGVYYAVVYSRRFREKERAASELALKASRLEASLTRANLEALRMQLNPHFLFNTLNTISVLALKGERQRVARMLSRLGDLLRLSLENDRQTMSLREELDFLERYLEIEQVRFRDRLSVDINVDEAAYEAEVPSLILQPIVENALKYGFAQTTGPGNVSIACRVKGNMLEMEVTDTGPGFPASRTSNGSTGVGIGNTRARLEQLYGGNYTLELNNRAEGGAQVRIRVPYQRTSRHMTADDQILARQA